MTRGMSVHGYSGFNYWISWECGACGERNDIQGSDDSGEVCESIDHYCEADD